MISIFGRSMWDVFIYVDLMCNLSLFYLISVCEMFGGLRVWHQNDSLCQYSQTVSHSAFLIYFFCKNVNMCLEKNHNRRCCDRLLLYEQPAKLNRAWASLGVLFTIIIIIMISVIVTCSFSAGHCLCVWWFTITYDHRLCMCLYNGSALRSGCQRVGEVRLIRSK